MKNDEKINYLYQITNVLRQMLNAEVLPQPVEQNISDAIVYLDCAKHNLDLSDIHDDRKDIYRVAPTIVARAEK